MKFSIFMMPLHYPTENPSLAFDRDISLIRYAEELGYDEFFIGEHHSGGWETMPAPEMALAKASAHAHRIRLGTSVISVPFHHPFHVAERMAFLDHLTKGRAILGVGPCALVTDKNLFGLATEKLYPMMAESVDIIVRLLESPDPIDYDGQYWKLHQMRLQLRSYQQPRMPLAIASSGNPISLELAGKYGMLLFRQREKTSGTINRRPNSGIPSNQSPRNMARKLRATIGGSPLVFIWPTAVRKPGVMSRKTWVATWNTSLPLD